MLMRRIREVVRAGWAAYRNPPGSVPRWRLEATERGPRIRGTPLLLADIRSKPFILHGLDLLTRICERSVVIAQVTEDGLQMGIDGLKLLVQTHEELYIVNEVFVNHCYNIAFGSPFVVIDVGMNVGFTSLWYANRSDVQKVYSFEPFPTTYRQGVRNFLANPIQATKIEHYNYGLGAMTENLEALYDETLKGKSSTCGVNDAWYVAGSAVRERVELREAGAEFDVILGNHPNSKVVVKIDCEGAEYKIIPTLEESGVLDRVAALIIEWHVDGPNILTKPLHRHGFTTVCVNSDGPFGMIYALKSAAALPRQ